MAVSAGSGGFQAGFPCAASLRDRPSGLKGASRRSATALRAALDPRASAIPFGRLAGRPVACPGAMRRKGIGTSCPICPPTHVSVGPSFFGGLGPRLASLAETAQRTDGGGIRIVAMTESRGEEQILRSLAVPPTCTFGDRSTCRP